MNTLGNLIWLVFGRLLTTVDLNELLTTAREKVTEENSTVSLKVKSNDLPSVLVDPKQLGFLFHELLCNAVRFRKEDDAVIINVSASRLLQNQFKSVPGKYKYVDYLKLDFTDNGSGMNAQYKDQALEMFKRLHQTSGLGVGLSLCRKIAENHGGSMVIDSKEGQGTTITVWLPVLKGAASAAEPKAENHQALKL